MPFVLNKVSDNENSFPNSLFVYSLANYEGKGLLLDILAKEGQHALIDVLKSKEFKNNMYQNGLGKEFDISKSSHILCNISDNNDLHQIDVRHAF